MLKLPVFQSWQELICELHEKNHENIERFCSEQRRFEKSLQNYCFQSKALLWKFGKVKNRCSQDFENLSKEIALRTSDLVSEPWAEIDKEVAPNYDKEKIQECVAKLADYVIDISSCYNEQIKNDREEKANLVCKIHFYLVILVTPIVKTLSLGFLRTSSLIKSPNQKSY